MNPKIETVDLGASAMLDGLRAFGVEPPMRPIGTEMKESTRLRFNRGVSPTGAQWRPLAMATILRRASRGRSLRRGGGLVNKSGVFGARLQRIVSGSHQPLMDTRTHLYNTVTYQADKTSAVIGVAAPWGGIHQRGGKAGRGRKVTIPARPFLGVSGEDRRAIDTILTRAVLARAGTALGASA